MKLLLLLASINHSLHPFSRPVAMHYPGEKAFSMPPGTWVQL